MDLRVAELHHRAAMRHDVIPLAGGLPADELLPRAALAAVLAQVATLPAALQYSWPEGDECVRAWIARRLGARGLRVEPAHVLVTAGAQQALALVAAELAGARISVGDATYPAALDAFAVAGALPTAASAGAGAYYLVTGAANPHGIDLVEPARAALVASGAELVVDEAYAELRFDAHVARPLAADAPDRTWHVGTISKTLCPGLRVGWIVPPARRRDAVLARKHAADLQTSGLSQLALARLLDVLDYDAMLARARHRYAARMARLLEGLRRHAPELRVCEPEGGFSVWCETGERGDDVALLEAALASGVSLDPGHMFRPADASGPVAFRLSFSFAPIDTLDEGARRIAHAYRSWRSCQACT
jgi:2-aminoadipate transaminase